MQPTSASLFDWWIKANTLAFIPLLSGLVGYSKELIVTVLLVTVQQFDNFHVQTKQKLSNFQEPPKKIHEKNQKHSSESSQQKNDSLTILAKQP